MPNPFSELKKELAGWEAVDGPMICQTAGCHEQVREGLYSEKLRIVTWKCSVGHISKIENYTYNE